MPGDFIPQVPRNLFKLYGQLTAELNVLAAGSSFARGNENNLDQPDGVFYNGSGKSAGYGIAGLGARYQVTDRVQLFVQMNNLLDKHYSTGAQLGTTPFDNNNHFVAHHSEHPTAQWMAVFRFAPRPSRRQGSHSMFTVD